MAEGDRLAIPVREAAQLLRVGPRTVYNLIRSGRLRAVRVGRLWRVPMQGLEEYLRGPDRRVPIDPDALARLKRLEGAWELLKALRAQEVELKCDGKRLGYDGSAVTSEMKGKIQRYGRELQEFYLVR